MELQFYAYMDPFSTTLNVGTNCIHPYKFQFDDVSPHFQAKRKLVLFNPPQKNMS